MPYINQRSRTIVDESSPTTAGELNYKITKLIWEYHDERGHYQSINDVVGALEGAKLEFYRRVAASYEDKKIIENGDVYV